MNRASGPRTATPPGGRQFEVSIDAGGPSIQVRVSGELDLAFSPILEDALWPYHQLDKPMVYDLGAVTFVDVAGIEVIARQCADGIARLRSASPVVRRLLHLIEEVSPVSTEGWWLDTGE